MKKKSNYLITNMLTCRIEYTIIWKEKWGKKDKLKKEDKRNENKRKREMRMRKREKWE